MDDLGNLPGVTSVAAAYAHPMDSAWDSSFQIEGVLEAPKGQRPEARLRPISPGYFETLGIPLERGRAFTDRDDEDAPGVAIVNQAFVRAYLPPGVEPLGQRLIRSRWWPDLPGTHEIVGVVSDVRFDGLAAPPGAAIYFPHHHVPFTEMFVLLRSAEDPVRLSAAVRSRVWELDDSLPVEGLRAMDDIVAASVAQPRFNMWLLGLFGFLALALAGIGIYGVIAYAFAQRTGELGIRQALGANKPDLMAMVLRQRLGLTALGAMIGVLGASWVVGWLASLLYGVSAHDPWTFGAVVLLLGAVAAAACYLPARRAVRVDPTVVLRYE